MHELGRIASQDPVQKEKEDKTKKLLDEILKQLRELVLSSTSIGEVRSKIDMLREIDPDLAEKLDRLLAELEKKVTDPLLNEKERLELILKSMGALQNASPIQFNPLSPTHSIQEDKPYRPDRVDGQISVSI